MKILEKTLNSIEPLSDEAMKIAWNRIDNLTKPIGSLGRLEEIAAKIAGITGKVFPVIKNKNIIIMCSDNGVVEENVTNNSQKITQIVTNNFTKDITGVSALCKFTGSTMTVVDIGVNYDFSNSLIINRKISYGTKNIVKGPAMDREQAIKAIEIGIEIVDKLAKEGVDILGTGEMGVGNTTTSAAVLSVLCSLSPEISCGRGSGITDAQLKCKIEAIEKAIKVNNPNKNDVIDVLSKVGGYDIAGLCGCFLGASKNRIPIVIDGFIASSAALCAYKLNPLCKDYMFASHLSAEPAAIHMLKEINLKPLLNLNMRLGEGSGCPLAFNIIEAAIFTMENMGTFETAKLDKREYIDIRKDTN
ncbi:nicotinate-nucleotide--dimethylbenzimidazole phosphoribosyltransferase [Haloimpatiens sp. FM7315]|uniref:nicotinate-nucleotide--dimethylbenzimidazole phosphoribosyltransferase n=1 Tax=Haloimpatiens sp. FM7315 TaxID=3298609 RepID=UPI0035A2988D